MPIPSQPVYLFLLFSDIPLAGPFDSVHSAAMHAEGLDLRSFEARPFDSMVRA